MFPCSYWACASATNPTHETQELQPRGECATLQTDGALTINADHLSELAYSSGLASVLLPDCWYYVTPDGRTAPVLTYDNGADYFSEGLARTRRSGKVGFVDRSLSVVILSSKKYEFAFEGGFAVVCQGCRSHSSADSEHSEMRGGSWGYIDPVGRVVVPVRFERDELPAPRP